jgi:hypothetical protein
MPELQNNFHLVRRLLSSRVPPDVAHGIAHEWLDKRGFLAMEDPVGALHAELNRRQRGDLRSMPGYRRVLAQVDALRLAELTAPQSFVDSLTPDEKDVMAQESDIFVEEGENLRSLLIGSLEEEGMLPALSHLKAQAARRPGPALGRVIGKLTEVLQQRQRRREQFADGLSAPEYEVVYVALDLWA